MCCCVATSNWTFTKIQILLQDSSYPLASKIMVRMKADDFVARQLMCCCITASNWTSTKIQILLQDSSYPLASKIMIRSKLFTPSLYFLISM
ncbi:putative protein isoform X3 [Capsicum chacoense]